MELQFDEAEAIPAAELPEEENTVTITYTRDKPKRRTLPEDLPREVIEHDIAELEKQCTCGCLKQRIGEEVTEQLEIIPAQLKVIVHVRPKYACNRCDEAVSIAPMPMREALISALLESHYLQADETPLQVINEPGRNNTTNSYMWVYQNAKPDKKVILFDYRETWQALWPKEILNGYQGYLQTDGYSGYDWVNQHSDIIHLGCMAHARRPFAELVKRAKTTGKSQCSSAKPFLA